MIHERAQAWERNADDRKGESQDMGKTFNVTADCKRELHYMVDISARLAAIKSYIDRGEYFTISRARQYGKTTTLRALDEYLKDEYYVIRMDFQMQMSYAKFRDENTFSIAFAKAFIRIIENMGITFPGRMQTAAAELKSAIRENKEELELVELFQLLSNICKEADRPLVLIIDEFDSAANNQVFLDFLSQLRGYYIDRDVSPTFRTVILAGVYDVKNLRRKLRPDEEHKMNSPWNIAADFDVNMELSQDGIKGMLDEYEADRQTGMNTEEMAGFLYAYTSGYPYLVSRLCKLMDEKIGSRDIAGAWTKEGFLEAVRLLLLDNNALFESLTSKLLDYPELEQILKGLLFSGKAISYTPTNQVINLALMFGFVKNEGGNVIPANRIFDTLLYNHFLSLDEMGKADIYKASLQDKNQFIRDGRLDMRRILEKFVLHFHELYGCCEEEFLEEEGRRYFLLYLRPIINGMGNYYVEARTRSLGRTDIIVDYRGEQMVIETKIWRGNEYNSRGERQLEGYLNDYGLQTGYMLSFNFNQKKQTGVHETVVGDKILIEAVV